MSAWRSWTAGAARVCVCVALLASPAIAEDWPLIRGDAAGTGVAKSGVPNKLDVLWEYKPGDTAFEGTPIVQDGVVYIGDADGGFHAVALADGAEKWSVSFEGAGFLGAAAAQGDRVIVGDFNGVVRCLSVEDGAELWTFDAESEVHAGANFYGGAVLVVTEAGSLIALDIESGEEQWRFTIDAPLRCAPTLVGQRVLLAGCDAKLHAVDVASGQEVSAVEIGAATGNTAAARGGRSYFGTEGGEFFSVDATGELSVAWRHRDSRRTQGIRTAAAVTDKMVVYASQGKAVYALDPQTGAAMWVATTRSRADASPVIAGDYVVVATTRGRVTLLDLLEGTAVFELPLGGSFLAAPAVVDSKVLIANEDGTLYCLGQKE